MGAPYIYDISRLRVKPFLTLVYYLKNVEILSVSCGQ